MLAIRNARVIDGTGRPPVEACSILIEDGKFTAVSPDACIPDAASVFNADGRTVMPALLEAHTHFSGSSGFDRPGFGQCRTSYEYSEAREMFLRWGVTAVRTCGDVCPDILDFRDAQQNGSFAFASPRVVSVGPWFQRAEGHPAFTVGPQVGLSDPGVVARACIMIDESTDIEAEVDRVADMNVDAVKVFLADIDKGNYPVSVPVLEADKVRRVTDAAHRRGKKVLCHVDGPDEMRTAAECGVDCIEHLFANGQTDTELSDELVTLLLEKGIQVDPTMICIRRWDDQVPGARPVYEDLKQAVKKLYDAGVPLYVGCDSGIPFVPFGLSLHDEMFCLNEAGIPAAEVLHMATQKNAELLGLSDCLGTIEPGKDADLILLREDPLTDIRNTKTIDRVWMQGRIVTDLTGE